MAIVVSGSLIALFYAVVTAAGLIIALIIGRRLHFAELVRTHCNTPEYWPSISATTGDFIEGRAVWRTAMVMVLLPRLIASHFMHKRFSELLSGVASSAISAAAAASQPLSVADIMWGFDVVRIISALGWTIIASSEGLIPHTAAFGVYMASGFILQTTQVYLAWRTQRTTSKGPLSFRLKSYCLVGQTVSALLVVKFFLDHHASCAAGLYSRSTMCEWAFAFFNIAFDATQVLDLEHETVTIGTQSIEDRKGSSSSSGAGANKAGPPSWALWIADLFLAYHHWGLLMQLYQSVYYVPMVAMRFTPEVVFAMAPGAALLLYLKPFNNFSSGTILGYPVYILFYGCSLVGFFGFDVTGDAGSRIVVFGMAVIFEHLALFTRLFVSHHSVDVTVADRTRVIYALPLGLVVTMCARLLYISLDPLHVSAVANVFFGVVLGFISILLLARRFAAIKAGHGHHRGGEDDIVPTQPPADENAFSRTSTSGNANLPAATFGVVFGLLCSISSVAVINSGTLPRYIALDPYPAGIFIILAFLAGLFYASRITRSGTTAAPSAALCIGGFLLFCFATTQSNRMFEKKSAPTYPTGYHTNINDVSIQHWEVEEMRGSPMVAFVGALAMVLGIGSLWPMTMEHAVLALQPLHRLRNKASRLHLFELFYFVFQLAPLMMHVYVVTFPFVPGGFLLGDRMYIPYLLTFGLIALLLPRVLSHAAAKAPAASAGAARGPSAPSASVFMSMVILLLVCITGRAITAPPNISVPPRSTAAPPPIPTTGSELMNIVWHTAALRIGGKPPQTLPKEDLAKAKPYGPVAPVTALIWTIHYGLDNFGVDSVYRLVDMVQKENPGIVGILESDIARIMNGNRDVMENLGYYLGMDYSDYGPTTFDSTFGCALVTKYPILYVRRYIMPSPVGELACLIHAKLDIMGATVNVYVGHWGNTEHEPDRKLQSEFLGKLAVENPGPSIFIGYLTTNPSVGYYNLIGSNSLTSPQNGLFRDTGFTQHKQRPWTRTDTDGWENVVDPADEKLPAVEQQYAKPPIWAKPRAFTFSELGLTVPDHPRYEYMNRYCQYILFKTGLPEDELLSKAVTTAKKTEGKAGAASTAVLDLLFWKRVLEIHELSDTEIQVAHFLISHRDE